MSINTRVSAALDRIARRKRPEPRPLRWLPLMALAAFPVGYALMMKTHSVPYTPGDIVLMTAGIILFIGAYLLSFYVRFFGPRLVPDAAYPLDERERMIRDRAGNLSGIAIAVMAIGGCFYLGVAPMFGGWSPESWSPENIFNEWIYLGMGMQGVYFTLPTLIASWLQPRAPVRD